MHDYSFERYQGLMAMQVSDPGASGVIQANNKGEFHCPLISATSESRTLAAPEREGQLATVSLRTDGGDVTLTVKDSAGDTTDTYTLDDAGDYITFRAVKSSATLVVWKVFASVGIGGVDGTVFDTLTVDTSLTLASAQLLFTGTTGTSEIHVADNLADALSLEIEGGADVFTIDTSTTKIRSAFTGALTVTPTQTLASATSLAYKGVSVPATTLTVTGTTAITTATGLNLVEIALPTYTDTMACAVTNAATLYIGGAPLAADLLTITNTYALWVDAGVARFDSNIDMAATASDILIAANTAAALEVSDGTNKLLAFDSRTTLKDVANLKITAPAPTIASETAAHVNASLQIAAKTITYTGTTATTSQLGSMLHVGELTVTDASAMTLTTASAVHVVALAAAGGSLTITNSYMISTSVSGAFLTNTGVWTDMACWEYGKEMVERASDGVLDAIEHVLDKLVPATWRYRSEFDATDMETGKPLPMRMDDMGRDRVGIIYDDLPGELRCPGEATAVAPGVLASFSLAACKYLYDRLAEVNARLAALESA